MVQHDAYPVHDGCTKRVPLLLDSTTFDRRMDDDSTDTSPDSAVPGHSPDIVLLGTRSSSRGSGSEPPEHEGRNGPGVHRSRSVSSGKSEKEKRKRSRVTPEQLVHLERFFTADRSPTAARRREISDLLGMQERQTQIWFQNRRAKAKLQNGKQKGRGGSMEVSPDSPPQLSTGFEVDLHNLIHEDEPVTIIPCSDLSIGTWRRIATAAGKHDLVAYVCDAKRCLTWFIFSAGFGFKMEISFEIIIDTEFTNATPGSGLASFLLSQPPIFYLEHASSPRPDGSRNRYWRRCSDWTESHQATHVLRHNLVGSAVQLSHVIRSLQNHAARSNAPLRHLSYRVEPPTSPMELPPPPMAGLTGPGYHYQNNAVDSFSHDQHDQSPRRLSYPGSTNSPDPAYSEKNDRRPPHSAPSSGSFSHQAYTAVSDRGTPASSNFGGRMYDEYAPSDVGHHGHSANEYADVPISHGVPPRPYSDQPIPRTFYNTGSRLMQPYQQTGIRMRRSHSSTSLGHQYEDKNSPPLLATSFQPPLHLLENISGGGHAEHLSSS